ncbi:MAG: sensor histidine kinase [Pseudomonadota bacterium]
MNDEPQDKARPLRWKLFNLIYVLFYFPEWLWRPPGAADIAAFVIGFAIFLPIYLRSFETGGDHGLKSMFAMETIALALSPFSGLHGVFHIYACVQAGFLRPGKLAVKWILGLTVFYAAFTLLSTSDYQDWINAAFALVFGVISGIGIISSAEAYEHARIRERAQSVERQHARLAERERIAHDLHDVLGHTLTMVALKSEVAAKLIQKDPERAREEIDAVTTAARSALAEIRETVYGMTITTLDAELDLARHALADAGITLTVAGSIPDLDAKQSKALGLGVREATTNIVRHANASRAEITFSNENQQIHVTISDDGRAAADKVREGAGLTGLRRRIRELGGETEIGGERGMSISIMLPHTS